MQPKSAQPASPPLVIFMPSGRRAHVAAVGNAAGDGARIALLNREMRAEAQRIAHEVRYVETAVDPTFQTEYVAAIHMPHASDSFPHLDGLVPDRSKAAPAPKPVTRARPRPS